MVPLVLIYFVLRFLYLAVDQRVMGLVNEWIGFRVPGLGLVLALMLLYLTGLLAGNIVGRKFFSVIEIITSRIPQIVQSV